MMKKCVYGFLALLIFTSTVSFAAEKIFSKEMERSDFRGQNLMGKDFSFVDLEHSNFAGANLTNANFLNADLEKCDFTKANLTKANFTNADLEEANLKGANVKGAIFKNAELEYAIWTDGRTCAEGSIGGCW